MNNTLEIISSTVRSLAGTKMCKTSVKCNKLPSEFIHPESADLDNALISTDYGRFHYKVLATSAFCLLSSGLQNNVAAYVLPAAHCELNLSSSQIGFINAAFLIGGACSSFLWGIVADLTGRRKVLILTLLLDVVTTLICAFVQNFIGLMICRFINGFFIGAPGSITFTYLAEFHSPKHRSKSIYYSGVFFTLSWVLLPTIAWLILPLQMELMVGSFVLCSSWRFFLVLLVIPELIASLLLLHLPETPKFLAGGDKEKALNVLQRMYVENTPGKRAEDFPVKRLKIDGKGWEVSEINGDEPTGKIKRILKEIYDQIIKLFQVPLVYLTLLICAIMFSNMFGYFGLGLWFPELLTRMQKFQQAYPNTTFTLNQLRNLTTEETVINIRPCLPKFDSFIFHSTLAMGGSTLIGNILSGVLAGKFDHKIIPLTTMFVGAISAGSIYWLKTSWQNLIAASVFQSAMSTANMAVGCVIVEIFPTVVNAMGICTAMFVGRVGAIVSNVLFGLLVDYNCEIAIFLVTAVLLLGTALCLLIPNDGVEESNHSNVGHDKNLVEVSIISTSM